ncbi:thiazole synthase [Ramlibacter sp.]|uniref:thiazole synthase n=1 Tax=Ramlibacter sp. TaxID=1917967 RepID=UPI002B654E17|nr:thiazole synthase [Ramlibacter sp.]HWI80838.1 thiazole synthase [Ramlibacter sp.]
MNQQMGADAWRVGDVVLGSRFLLGTSRYPSPQALREAIAAAGAQVLTVGLKRALEAGSDDGFVVAVRETVAQGGHRLLPNTAGCYSAREAVQVSHMARELYGTSWVKLEVIGDRRTLQPDMFETIVAARELVREGFVVFPYCSDDLVGCRRLLDAGCPVLMPWGAPIGSGQGLNNPFALRTLREALPDATLIVDAGLGAPSHAARAMELGFDAVLLNTAVAQAGDPAAMARAFRLAIEGGRLARRAGVIATRDFAVPSTPVAPGPVLGEAAP